MSANFKHLIRRVTDKVASLKKNRVAETQTISHALPESPPSQKIEITASAGTMAKFVALTILLLLLTAFLYRISDILITFFVALLFAAALDPMVDALERKKIPRSLGVIIIYLFGLLLLGFFIANLAPVVASEISQLAARVQEFIANIVKGEIALPPFLERFRPGIKDFFDGVDISRVSEYKEDLLKVAEQLSKMAGNVFNAIIVLFNGFFNTILVLILTFLMTVDESGIDNFILSLFPTRYGHYIRAKSNAIKQKMGYWLRGQVALCVIVGVLVYIGFFIIGLFTQKVEYAATIALLAGFTELIPYAGPFIAWVIALPIVANQSVMLIVWMTVLLYIVQLLENNFIVPMVMSKAVGISPILIIFAMFVGFYFLGILGMILAVPVATGVALFIKDYAEREK